MKEFIQEYGLSMVILILAGIFVGYLWKILEAVSL